MPRDKLTPQVERNRHFHAFEVYRDLGYRRSFREVARQVGATASSVCRWAKLYHWDERLEEYGKVVETKKEEGALVKVDDPVVKKMMTLMEQVEAAIDSVFLKDVVGKSAPTFKITNAKELTELVGEYRKLLETYHKFLSEYRPADAADKRGTTIKEFNLIMGNMSQEERINMMKGLMNGNEPGRNKRPQGECEEADYTEVSERGDAD